MEQDLFKYMNDNNISQEQIYNLVQEEKVQLVYDLEGVPSAIIEKDNSNLD